MPAESAARSTLSRSDSAVSDDSLRQPMPHLIRVPVRGCEATPRMSVADQMPAPGQMLASVDQRGSKLNAPGIAKPDGIQAVPNICIHRATVDAGRLAATRFVWKAAAHWRQPKSAARRPLACPSRPSVSHADLTAGRAANGRYRCLYCYRGWFALLALWLGGRRKREPGVSPRLPHSDMWERPPSSSTGPAGLGSDGQ